jgi:hypothetical protein
LNSLCSVICQLKEILFFSLSLTLSLFLTIYVHFFKTGHYYGTPRPPKEALLTNGQHQYLSSNSNNTLLRRSNSANEMFQQQRTNDNGVENNGI